VTIRGTWQNETTSTHELRCGEGLLSLLTWQNETTSTPSSGLSWYDHRLLTWQNETTTGGRQRGRCICRSEALSSLLTWQNETNSDLLRLAGIRTPTSAPAARLGEFVDLAERDHLHTEEGHDHIKSTVVDLAERDHIHTQSPSGETLVWVVDLAERDHIHTQ